MKVSELLKLAAEQVGYKAGKNKNNKYGQYFDSKPPKGAWQFFNGRKNFGDWCSLLVHWLFCQLEDPAKVRKLLGEPSDPNKNCAAGVLYFWRYLRDVARRTRKNKKEGKPGDIIFFNTKMKPGHVGIIEKVTTLRYYTIEGNTGGGNGKVKRKKYLKGSSKIFGIGYYPYDKE